eukprot:2951003-Amphidinium_carterae.1
MSGPIVVPPLGTWGGMHVGGPETVMVVLGAGFTINHTFATAWATTPLRAMKGWYKHKSLFTEPLVPLKRRFVSVAAVCKSSLFWGLVAAPLTASLLEDIDRQALKFARLSA